MYNVNIIWVGDGEALGNFKDSLNFQPIFKWWFSQPGILDSKVYQESRKIIRSSLFENEAQARAAAAMIMDVKDLPSTWFVSPEAKLYVLELVGSGKLSVTSEVVLA
jgi:hypothetical protein